MNSTNAPRVECPGCKVQRLPLSRGSWCTTCGFNPVYEEKLGKVMREAMSTALELLVECRTLVAVAADPESKAPGKRGVAKELLRKIDSLLAEGGGVCATKDLERVWLLSRKAKPGGPDEPRRMTEGVALSEEDAQMWVAESGEYENQTEEVPVWRPVYMMVSGDVDLEDPETAEALEDIRQAAGRKLREKP